MSIHTDGYDHHADEAAEVMKKAGVLIGSTFVLPGEIRAEMRDSDEPNAILHDYITGPLRTNVLRQAQAQLDTLISPGGTAPPYLAKHLHIAELLDLARTIQDYAENVTPKQ